MITVMQNGMLSIINSIRNVASYPILMDMEGHANFKMKACIYPGLLKFKYDSGKNDRFELKCSFINQGINSYGEVH